MNIFNTLMLHFTLCKTSNIPIKCENCGFIMCLFFSFSFFFLVDCKITWFCFSIFSIFGDAEAQESFFN